jgi:hypothetical protein
MYHLSIKTSKALFKTALSRRQTTLAPAAMNFFVVNKSMSKITMMAAL